LRSKEPGIKESGMGKNPEISWSDEDLSSNRVPLKKIGVWDISYSRADNSVHIRNSDHPSQTLKLSRDSLYKLIGSLEKLTGRTSAAAATETQAAEVPAEKAGSDPGKRKFKRYLRPCEAEFVVNNIIYSGIASDFSLNGLFMKTVNLFPPSTVLDLTLYLPDGTAAILKGKVQRALKTPLGNVATSRAKSPGNGMGIQLLEKDPTYLNFIRSLIV